jgi:hypothetical protein
MTVATLLYASKISVKKNKNGSKTETREIKFLSTVNGCRYQIRNYKQVTTDLRRIWNFY